jgi:hypothetical protein
MDEVMQLTMNPLQKLTICKKYDVVVDKVGLKDVESALVTLKQFIEQRPTDVTHFIQSAWTLKKEIGS